jgi:hypothetical protein
MLTATPFADLSARMTGRVVTPSDRDWDATRQVFNPQARGRALSGSGSAGLI